MTEPGIAIVMDYQNVHQIGRGLFKKRFSLESTSPHPMWLASHVAQRRRLALMRQGPGRLDADLAATLHDPVTAIHVHRGIPNESKDPKGYRINLKQKATWEAHPEIQVHLRPLQYSRSVRCAHDATKVERAREKGVDTAVATRLIELVIMQSHRVIIVMSQDSDLAPAIEFAQRLGRDGVHIEAAGWERSLRHRNIWNTWLDKRAFDASRDRVDYEHWWQNRGQHTGWRRYLAPDPADISRGIF